jgi:hypothetical protein
MRAACAMGSSCCTGFRLLGFHFGSNQSCFSEALALFSSCLEAFIIPVKLKP